MNQRVKFETRAGSGRAYDDAGTTQTEIVRLYCTPLHFTGAQRFTF